MNPERIEQMIRLSFEIPRNGINDAVSKVNITFAGLKGDIFCNMAHYVTVTFNDRRLKPLNLFVKVQLDNRLLAGIVAQMRPFEKEAMFLTNYSQAAEEMCALKGYPDFIDFYPKCYYDDQNMAVLESLVDEGYSLKSEEERQDLESAQFAIRTLAKHHAIGHVMIAENGGPEQFFQRFPHLNLEVYDNPQVVQTIGDLCNDAVELNIKILEDNEVSGAKEAAQKLKEFIGKPMSIMLQAIKQPTFNVLCHGNYWNNNMMFKCDNATKEIVHHVAIDLQITRYNSPSIDLGYYFFTSVQPHVRMSHLKELLTLYKDTFNEVTQDFGHETNITYEKIFNDFRQKLGYGFWFGFMTSTYGMGVFKHTDDVPKIKPEKKGKEAAEELVKLIQEYDEWKI